MKEQALIKKIDDRIKLFKSRALKGPDDDKRHDPVRQDEQKWMVAAYDKLGWSFAKIGSAFGRDWRTVKQNIESYERQRSTTVKTEELEQDTTRLGTKLKTKVANGEENSLQNNSVKDRDGIVRTEEEKKPYTFEKPSDESKHNVDPEISQSDSQNVPCLAPPVDVVILEREWKVPAKKAPGILQEWRFLHRNGHHDLCLFFPKLAEYLKDGVPYEKAEAMLHLHLRAEKFHIKRLHEEIEAARDFRIWQSKENWKAWYKEYKELHKPSLLRLEHLSKISDLLTRFRKETETAISNQLWDMIFDIENDELFFTMLDHSRPVGYWFDQVRGQRYEYESSMQKLIFKMAQESPPGANADFLKSAARYALNVNLLADLPDYRIAPHSDTEWKLSVWDSDKDIDIAAGSRNGFDSFKKLHLELINKHKRDPEIKRLLELRKKIRGKLKPLNKEIKNALDNKEYTRSFCLRCPS